RAQAVLKLEKHLCDRVIQIVTLAATLWGTKRRNTSAPPSEEESVMNRTSRWLALLGILACLALSGCIPNVVWLPDSSGFVFSESGPAQPKQEPRLRLVKYDIAKKQRDIIVDNLKNSMTTWPAINPAGTEIAVASVTWKGDQSKLQLTFYDTTGKELRVSQ